MRSPSGFIFMIIAILFFNCLHYVAVGGIASNSSSKSSIISTDKHAANNKIGNRMETVEVSRNGLRRIDITRKRSVHLNGVEIDENSLVHHLKDHERELIFGKSDKAPRAVKLVHLRHLTDANVPFGLKAQMPHRIRRAVDAATVVAAAADTNKASIENATERQSDVPQQQQQQQEPSSHEVSVQIQDNDHLVNLRLHPTPKLIDDAFIFIRRYANSTQFIEDSHKLAARYERCFYSNENAALDLCDDENVRGVYHHNATDFVIQPLPARFGNSTHVILEREPFRREWSGSAAVPPREIFDEHLQFEPDVDDFNELNVMNLAATVEDNEEMPRLTRNIEENVKEETPKYSQRNQQQHQHQSHHQVSRGPQYKPRYRYNDQHHSKHKLKHHQQQHHHQEHHQQKRQHHQHHQKQEHRNRIRRHINSSGSSHDLHIETAIFVDNDLVRHMSKNFPQNTERHLMRFVLAMINAVQLLYHHPTLGHRVNFILKRLEILYKDPPGLGRSSDIDTYLSNFCMWQKINNPSSDKDILHYDHAVILTGLDLYVVGKNGKVISQVVGLAPVAGMCTPTSSCTINEGKHFESVFVVAHEIGHNLGMRHDTNENGCDPSLNIMSPTLGSGKITWSKCSRTYLQTFLDSSQSDCLLDRGQFANDLDHSAEGLMPGERFDADQQCMLKYGRDSVSARTQPKSDICRDLHCQRDRYTWTSHPALEGTECGDHMWCSSGACVARPNIKEHNNIPRDTIGSIKSGAEKSSFLEATKMGHLLYGYNHNRPLTWSDWDDDAGECASGCLYGPSKRLREGSTGLRTFTRSCHDYRRRCLGRDKKYESCIAKQCYTVNITTIDAFATGVCEKAQKFDSELTGVGTQIVGDIEESCKIFCKTKSNGTKSRSWTFPDGTTCHSRHYSYDATAYCIGGRCEKFSCDNATNNYYKIDPTFCRNSVQDLSQQASVEVESRHRNSYNSIQTSSSGFSGGSSSNSDNGRYNERDINYYNNDYNHNRIYGPTTARSKYENEVAVRNFHGQNHDSYKRKSDNYAGWNKYSYHFNQQYPAPPANPPVSASLIAAPAPQPPESEWIVKSGCHSSCMAKSKGIQVVVSRRTGANNIQLCTHTAKPCDHLLTPTEYAENTCSRYKLKVRGLSGYGTQIAASVAEPDRSCRVGCQDEFIKYRFYLVNGKYGHFPLGTKCSNTEDRYCVNGKCLEFGADNIPLQQSHISLALYRNRRSIATSPEATEMETEMKNRRSKRSYLYYTPVNITETITQEFINSIVNSIINLERKQVLDELHTDTDHIEFTNPIHMSMDELTIK